MLAKYVKINPLRQAIRLFVWCTFSSVAALRIVGIISCGPYLLQNGCPEHDVGGEE